MSDMEGGVEAGWLMMVVSVSMDLVGGVGTW